MAKKKPTRRRRPSPIHLFVDTNIFLDFYRNRQDANFKLLERLKPVKERVICTYQVEMEFLKNRQRALKESLDDIQLAKTLKPPPILADSTNAKTAQEQLKKANLHLKKAQAKITDLLNMPSSRTDPVYEVLETIFQSNSSHVLTRDMPIRHQIKRRAWRRFMLGYPPRKHDDTSIGDAVNWEWIIECGKNLTGKIIIVSRDSDYGTAVNGDCFLNNQLKQEYRDRVGKRRPLLFVNRLSDALKEMHVNVTKKEVDAESEHLEKAVDLVVGADSIIEKLIGRWADKPIRRRPIDLFLQDD